MKKISKSQQTLTRKRYITQKPRDVQAHRGAGTKILSNQSLVTYHTRTVFYIAKMWLKIRAFIYLPREGLGINA